MGGNTGREPAVQDTSVLRRWRGLAAATLLGSVLGACAPAVAPPAAPPPTRGEARLPEIPAVDGPLQVDVVHPPENELVGAVDSTFIFGSVGSGRATLTINGAPVSLAPNGAFLAFLPVPADGVYRLVAQREGEQSTLERRVRLAASPVRFVAGTQIVAGSAYPRGSWAVGENESVEVGFRGTSGGQAWVVLPSGERYPLRERQALVSPPPGAAFQTDAALPTAPAAARPAGAPGERAVALYSGLLPAVRLATADTSIARPVLATSLLTAGDAAGGEARFELVVDGDTARASLPLNLETLRSDRPRTGTAVYPGDGSVPWDWTVRGRNHPVGPFHYFWPHGTRFTITGERDGMLRVELFEGQTAWVPAGDVRIEAAGAARPASLIGSARFRADSGHIDLRVPLGERLPFHVQMEDARTLDVFVYGATSTANFFQYGSLDPLMESAEWRQPADGVFQVRVRLTQPVWGWQSFHDEAGALVVRIRRPPIIDAARPLRGLRVVVDPGHPPGGATGPTRLTEADANLYIALQLQPLLEAAGADVVMIRTDTSTVALADRPRISTEQNGDVFVSVHNNAFPDGVNPFRNHGTSVYYFFPHSVELAQAMQSEILAELGLPDIGIGRADLAVVRQTWMPSVLTESMFMMFPRQEAALRDARVHERLARAHLRALESFLRARAGWQH